MFRRSVKMLWLAASVDAACWLETEFDFRFRLRFSQFNQVNQPNCVTKVEAIYKIKIISRWNIYKIEIWNMESSVGRVDACCLFLIIRTRVKKKNLKLYCLNRIKNKMITSKSRLNSRRVQADWEGMMKCPNPNILIEIVVDEEF